MDGQEVEKRKTQVIRNGNDVSRIRRRGCHRSRIAGKRLDRKGTDTRKKDRINSLIFLRILPNHIIRDPGLNHKEDAEDTAGRD